MSHAVGPPLRAVRREGLFRRSNDERADRRTHLRARGWLPADLVAPDLRYRHDPERLASAVMRQYFERDLRVLAGSASGL